MEPIIIGIDPGTTTAVAIFDLERGLIFKKSSKDYGIPTMIRDITSKGTPVVVACDKKKMPAFVQKTAVALGAYAFSPKEDISVNTKKDMTSKIGYKNDHERDAMSAALFSFKFFSAKIAKLKRFIAEHDVSDEAELIRKVLFGMSLDEAARSMHDESVRLMNLKKRMRSEDSEKRLGIKISDYKAIISDLEKKNQLLKKQNFDLKKEITKIRESQVNSRIKDIAGAKASQMKHRIKGLDEQLKQSRKTIENLILQKKKLMKIIEKSTDFSVIEYEKIKENRKIRPLYREGNLTIVRNADLEKTKDTYQMIKGIVKEYRKQKKEKT